MNMFAKMDQKKQQKTDREKVDDAWKEVFACDSDYLNEFKRKETEREARREALATEREARLMDQQANKRLKIVKQTGLIDQDVGVVRDSCVSESIEDSSM